MDKETVEMRLEAHVQNLVKMGVVDVGKHAEHLLIDGLARGVEILGESAVLSDPGFARRSGGSGD